MGSRGGGVLRLKRCLPRAARVAHSPGHACCLTLHWPLLPRAQVSSGSMAEVLGKAQLTNYYNDGSNGTGDYKVRAMRAASEGR